MQRQEVLLFMDVQHSPGPDRPCEAPRSDSANGSVQFAVLASGSKGNSTLVRGQGAGLLIDVGIGPKALADRLASVGASWSLVGAVVLTHTHSDHVDSASFAELARRGVRVHCHDGHRAELVRDAGFQKLEEDGLVRCYDDRPFLISTGHQLEPIKLRHDGGPTFGFRIDAPARRYEPRVSLGYLADTGCWSEAMVESLADIDVLGVEFNHDVAMQKASRRPVFLIERNLSDDGHLSNSQGADLIQAVLARSRARALQHVVLLHLSEQCNQPELALQVARDAIRSTGRRVRVHAAQQCPASPNLWIAGGRRVPAAKADGAKARPNESQRRGLATARPTATRLLPGLTDEPQWLEELG
jgi:phosphoribosyl 1,2-cyclic phosphodiesterase